MKQEAAERSEKQLEHFRETFDRLTAASHVQTEYFGEHKKIEGYYQSRMQGQMLGCDRLMKQENMFGRLQLGYNPNRERVFLFANLKTSRYDTVASRYQKERKEYQQKTISISLRCADAITTFPEEVGAGTTNNGCDYTVFFRSAYACPTECPHVNGNVCGSHGVCGYDEELRTARCYCGSRYTGVDCMAFKYKSLLSVDALIIAVTVVVAIVVIYTILYVWNKLRKISVNPDAFDSLENKFNELGQMAY